MPTGQRWHPWPVGKAVDLREKYATRWPAAIASHLKRMGYTLAARRARAVTP